MTHLIIFTLSTQVAFKALRRFLYRPSYFKAIFFSLAILLFPHAASSATHIATPSDNLQHILNNAQDGDTILLSEGTYQGNFTIPHAITLKAKTDKQAIIDANGTGNALFIEQSHTNIEDLKIINWGQDLTEQNAGIYSKKGSEHLVIKNNYLNGDAFGIWLEKGKFIQVMNNVIIGNPKLRSADRGNAIQLSIVQNVEVRNNDVSKVRDGLYIISSQNNVLENNTMHDLRYGIHYMYSHSNTVKYNTAYNTRAGYALMSSRNLDVHHNISRDSEDYGFLLNFITSSKIHHNQIYNVWTKPEHKVLGREGKGLFVYNSAYNSIDHNTVDTAEIGIHLTAGSEKTKVFANNFINNPVQVKFVANREEEWSKDGIGNYWSNYLGWDLNNDNQGDAPFEPNDGIDKLVWQYPEAKMLLDSPAVLILRWIQGQFPVLKPAGVKDSHPLMQPIMNDDNKSTLTMANNTHEK
ncbi:nitrous oxide reductase family maturation protein NosD [Parashewanella spongiae]|uniref:Nitrous oxide reductase family maturation protein NosD n=1 Tax=Parashewanella spongiae TaxID=342950 RepID=A0A3A6TZA2_9GAMM|nr:nitrous oxide reductase family maturation protein NosD [Parashewanella spongiae]MCL1077927.1 nitrous oxide reductase family maturation protein NosD [Parashewanella spongiae]RJY18470.1 nitrous oxide reductase family maturation protein NosD [Parashewanella spongiae]